MAANTNMIFTLTPNVGQARLAAANVTRDASTTTNIATLFTAGANGSRIERVSFVSAQAAVAACSANVGRLFLHDGTNYRLLNEVAWGVVTSSATAAGMRAVIAFPGGLIIPTGWTLRCSIHTYAGVQDQTDVIAEGGDY